MEDVKLSESPGLLADYKMMNIRMEFKISLTPLDKWERIKLKVKELFVKFSTFQQKVIKTRAKIIDQEIEKNGIRSN